MAIRYEPQVRAAAAEAGQALVTFDLTALGPAVAAELGLRGITFSGPVPPALAREMYDAFYALWRRRNDPPAAAPGGEPQ